jgi:hypothetical protein
MKADQSFPTALDARCADADTLYFRNGGMRKVVRLTEEEWRACKEVTDPRLFMAKLTRVFLKNNPYGFGVIDLLLRAQKQDDDTDDSIFPYDRRTFGKLPFKHRRLREGGMCLSACADGREALPLRFVVVVARLFGVPQEELLARGSKAAERHRSHRGLRAESSQLTPAEQELYLKVAPIVDALPLRHPLPPQKALELYRRMLAIS